MHTLPMQGLINYPTLPPIFRLGLFTQPFSPKRREGDRTLNFMARKGEIDCHLTIFIYIYSTSAFQRLAAAVTSPPWSVKWPESRAN